MKKIILFILALLWNFTLVGAANLEVKSNLESGEYHFPIEINLITNDKNAKIFYYTDGEGRMDNIKEFKSPLLLKEDTTIEFYATNKDYEDTLIQTSKYTFSYSEKINIEEKNGKIIIKNTSGDIQNIGYRKLESDNLNYEITPNTYIENKESYQIDYELANQETVQLFSPDKKVIKTFVYKTPPLVPPQSRGMPDKAGGVNNETGEIKTPPVSLSLDIPLEGGGTGTGITSRTENNSTEDLTVPPQHEASMPDKAGGVKNETISLNNALKTSVIDTKNESKENKSNNLFIILGVLFLFILYNIGLFLKKSETFKEFKTKINKIGKK